MPNETKVLSGTETVRSLYKSLASCSEHHSNDLLSRLHIVTPIDDAIALEARSDKVVIVTGNPGDGKTHLIRKVRGEFNRRVIVHQDANEIENAGLTKAIDDAITEKLSLVLAINEGILLEVCESAKARYPWADGIVDAVLQPYDYGDGREIDRSRVVILDLNLRNNLAITIVEQAIAALVALIEDDSTAPAAIRTNAAALKNLEVRHRVCQLLDAVGGTGFHATMRDLLGFIAYLLTGDSSNEGGDETSPYFVNAFESGQGPLFDEVRRFDPLAMPSPFLDDRLYMLDDAGADWLINLVDEPAERANLDLFRRRKRRAYFEHRDGLQVLYKDRDDSERTFKELQRLEQSPEQVAIRLLNQFFDSRELASDRLILWMGHQFDARPALFVAARHTVSSVDLQISIPRLASALAPVFEDHYADHVILHHKEMEVGQGLILDRRLVEMLIAGGRHLGFGTRNPEAFRRIAAFYDRLTRIVRNPQSIVQILRLDNMARARVGVNIAAGEYFIPGGIA